MILLTATNQILEITTAAAADIDYTVTYADITTTTFVPSTSEGKVTTATTATIVAAPAASTQRQVKFISITNRHATTTNTVTVKKDISASEYNLTPPTVLLPGESLQYIDGEGWLIYSAAGGLKQAQTAAGTDGQIQFNSNGALAGDPNFTWDTLNNELYVGGSNANILMQGVTTEPAAPATGTMYLYAKEIVGKMQPKIKGPSGLDTPLQAALWQNNIVWWTPSTAAGVFTGTSGSTLGTAAIVTPTTTNLYTAMRRSTFATVVTTTNQQVGIRTENMFFRGSIAGQGGFLFVCRFGLNTWTAGDRLFVGLSAGTTAVVTVQPSTLLNTLGFCIEAGDTAITFLRNDAAGTGVKTAIAGQPALATNNGYDAFIWCAPNSTSVNFRLDNALTGATLIDSFATTDLPVNTTMLTAQAIMSNGANTPVNAATIGINRMYIETDR